MTSLKNDFFPVFRFAGSHRAIGRAYGESCRALIRTHHARAEAGVLQLRGGSAEEAHAQALAYRPHVLAGAAFFDEEIQGLAEGAGLTLGQAYLLQLRAELSPSRSRRPEPECTTLAVAPSAAADGRTYAGQIADLPTAYLDLGVVVEFAPDDQPAVLMFTPAGQLSYIGVNDRGLCCFANYLHCDGWRMGMPRYFLSRIAMLEGRVDAALARVRSVTRASSRNLLMADAAGAIVDLETTVTRDAALSPQGGVLAHANHYVAPSLLSEERASDAFLYNSRQRHARMDTLLREGAGRHAIEGLQAIARDRVGWPHCISRAPGDGQEQVMSVACAIAAPASGQLWVAKGPPHEHAFEALGFTLSRQGVSA